MRSRRVVLVFARLPGDERRAKPLVAGAPARVEALHRALLARTLATARAVDADVRWVTTGDAAAPSVEVVRQIEGTFEARLERAVADAFAAGWEQVAVIGADAPGLTRAHLRAAFRALDDGPRRAVLGPARDGGYYLLALNAFAPVAFSVALCTKQTFDATRSALAHDHFVVQTLAPLRDVDDAADLRALARSTHPARRLAALVLQLPSTALPLVVPPLVRPFSSQPRPRGPPLARTIARSF